MELGQECFNIEFKYLIPIVYKEQITLGLARIGGRHFSHFRLEPNVPFCPTKTTNISCPSVLSVRQKEQILCVFVVPSVLSVRQKE
jgi:hypothetical protein